MVNKEAKTVMTYNIGISVRAGVARIMRVIERENLRQVNQGE